MGAANLKKKDTKNNTQRIEVDVEEFVPYACHYDDRTILTKNGELMQVIKVTGFTYESVKKDDAERLSLRRALRQAIMESITTNNFALYFHTIRRKRDLSTGGVYPPGFAKELHQTWTKRHDWEHQYINELYVTIIIEGQSLSMKDVRGFFRAINFPKEMRYRMGYLDKSAQELDAVVGNIMQRLESYGAQRLQIREHPDGIYYSELSGFLSKILNLKYEPIPLATVDLSTMLPSHRILFGYNALEVKGDTGRHFGAMLTIKEYHEISSSSVDELLQIPQQFIVTETFDFVNNKKGMEAFAKQRRYMQITDDKFLAEASGLNAILAANKGTSVDFGEHQITIMILEDTLALLERGVGFAVEALQSIGVFTFREDIFMEDSYWAQLPGNFEFNKRMTSINTSYIGGYASLYNFPAGKLDDNHWGPAVTVFHTAAKTPYFFNFHYGDNGHTFIVGPYGSGKTVLMNFLVSESLKFSPKLYFFDQERGSEIFLRAIGAEYHQISIRNKNAASIRFNPLKLRDTPKNRKFLNMWMQYLISDRPEDVQEKDWKKIHDAVEYLFTLEERSRNLTNILPKFWPMDTGGASEQQTTTMANDPLLAGFVDDLKKEAVIPSMEDLAKQTGKQSLTIETLAAQQKAEAERLAALEDDLTAQAAAAAANIPVEVKIARWYGEGEFAHLFDNEEDGLDFSGTPMYGFEMTQALETKPTLIPLMFYLLHSIENSLDGNPTIIVLDEAWTLIDNAAFTDHLSEWMDRLREKNAILIFATESVESAEESQITETLAEKIETKIFLANPEADASGYEKIFGLSDNEFEMLKSIEPQKRRFLLKHNIDAVVAELSLKGMHYELAVLSSTIDNIAVMSSAIGVSSKDPKDWLPYFRQSIRK